MQYLFTPSIALGLFDYIQVILFAVGMYFLSKYTYRNATKLYFFTLVIGAIIATLAGISKATWKLLYALSGVSIDIMNRIHMPGLALGTILIFIACIYMTRRDKLKFQQSSTTHAFPFYVLAIGLLTISTIGYLICLILIAARKKYKWVVVSFIVYIVVVLITSGLSSSGEHELTHWICEILGVVSNSMLIFGTYTLYKRDITTVN